MHRSRTRIKLGAAENIVSRETKTNYCRVVDAKAILRQTSSRRSACLNEKRKRGRRGGGVLGLSMTMLRDYARQRA